MYNTTAAGELETQIMDQWPWYYSIEHGIPVSNSVGLAYSVMRWEYYRSTRQSTAAADMRGCIYRGNAKQYWGEFYFT